MFKNRAVPILIIVALIGTAWLSVFALNYYRDMLAAQQAREERAQELIAAFQEEEEEENTDTKEEILARYESRFRELQNQAVSSLEDLFEEAVEEYKQQKNKSSVDRFKLTNKYIQEGRDLEKTFDAAFSILITDLEAALSKNGHPTEITGEIEKAYKEAKNEMKQELFGRLLKKQNES